MISTIAARSAITAIRARTTCANDGLRLRAGLTGGVGASPATPGTGGVSIRAVDAPASGTSLPSSASASSAALW